jgi:AAA domain
MHTKIDCPPNCVLATYAEQRIPQFKSNPLIEALPPTMTDESLVDALTLLPDFASEQRDWPVQDRMMMLESLQNFMVPLGKHIELGRALDAMLRAGYVGRAPRTPGHAQIFQTIYDKQNKGETFSQTATTRTPQMSTSLVGISGMGKTTTVNRWCAHIPQVIYHPEHNLYQIPYLHIEMPSDGSSIKGLAHGILQKIDELIPGADYYAQYAQKGRTGADILMRGVARVMNLHLVGLLICDEVQNLANAKKGGQTVMTEIVSACNDLKVPILFIGTNKAAQVLSLDFRQARRASGHGIAPWDRLRKGTAAQTSEWDEFLTVLWQFQWVKNPVPLDPLFNNLMYDYSQGVIDLAIKLFASSQARVMLDGSEALTPETLADVFNNEFKLMHPMVAALRDDDLETLANYDDIAPLNLTHYIDNATRKLRMAKSPLFSVKSDDVTFKPRLAAGLTAMGFDADEALDIVDAQASTGQPITLVQGIQNTVKELTTAKPLRKSKGTKKLVIAPETFDARPADYRRAVADATARNTDVLSQLKAMGMAPNLEDVIELI